MSIGFCFHLYQTACYMTNNRKIKRVGQTIAIFMKNIPAIDVLRVWFPSGLAKGGKTLYGNIMQKYIINSVNSMLLS